MKQIMILGRYEIKRFFKNGLKILAAALVFSTLVAFTSRGTMTSTVDSADLSFAPTSVGMFLFVGFIILPMVENKRSFNFHIQNGFIRRDIYIARHLSFLINAFIFVILNLIISVIIYYTPFNELFSVNSLENLPLQALVFFIIYYILASISNFYAVLYNKFKIVGILIIILVTNLGGRMIYPLSNLLFPNLVAWLTKMPPQGEVSITYVAITFTIMLLLMNFMALIIQNKTEVTV